MEQLAIHTTICVTLGMALIAFFYYKLGELKVKEKYEEALNRNSDLRNAIAEKEEKREETLKSLYATICAVENLQQELNAIAHEKSELQNELAEIKNKDGSIKDDIKPIPISEIYIGEKRVF